MKLPGIPPEGSSPGTTYSGLCGQGSPLPAGSKFFLNHVLIINIQACMKTESFP